MKPHAYPPLPKPVAGVLGRLPRFPGSLLFAAALTRVLGPHLAGDVRAAMENRTISIVVLDAGLRFDVSWRASRFVALAAPATADLSIGASARDFLLLAQRREDPDTLFFSRRLTMEGDTELGLLVKNTLDAIDVALFDPARLLPARWRRAAST